MSKIGGGDYTRKSNVPQNIDRETKRDNVAKVTRTHAQHTRTASQSVKLATATVGVKAEKAEKPEKVEKLDIPVWSWDELEGAQKLVRSMSHEKPDLKLIVKNATKFYKNFSETALKRGIELEDLVAHVVNGAAPEIRSRVRQSMELIEQKQINVEGTGPSGILRAARDAAIT
jgi:TolB-like protein